jgi:hypothetical protein
MATMVDAINTKPFQLLEMVEAINKLPWQPGQAGAAANWVERGIATTTIEVEERNGVLSLVSASARGGPSSQYKPAKRVVRTLATTRLSIEDQINASELQNVRTFGTADQLQALAQIRDDRLSDMLSAIRVTWEHLQLNALKGIVLDADGTTTIADLFTTFGITQESEVAFDLTNSTAGTLTTKLATTRRTLMNNLGADSVMVDHIHVLCSPSFFDALVVNVDVMAWAKIQPNSEFLRQSRVFGRLEWQGFVFEEYRVGTATGNENGDLSATGAWIATDKCVIFPVGPNIYRQYFAPGEFFGAVNTMGLPLYARTAADDDWDEYIKLKVQSYPLPICTRPAVLMKGKKGS